MFTINFNQIWLFDMPSQSSAIKMSGNAYRLFIFSWYCRPLCLYTTAVNVLEPLREEKKNTHMEKLSSTYVFAELQSCTYTYNLLQFLAEMDIQHTAYSKTPKTSFFFSIVLWSQNTFHSA